MNDAIPAPTITVPNPRFEELVARRAWQLCRAAEPHSHERDHMLLHTSEARLQLGHEYDGQSGAEGT